MKYVCMYMITFCMTLYIEHTYVSYLNKVMMESYACMYVYHTVKLCTCFFCGINMCVCVCVHSYVCMYVANCASMYACVRVYFCICAC